jgi:hypothetical protein
MVLSDAADHCFYSPAIRVGDEWVDESDLPEHRLPADRPEPVLRKPAPVVNVVNVVT